MIERGARMIWARLRVAGAAASAVVLLFIGQVHAQSSTPMQRQAPPLPPNTEELNALLDDRKYMELAEVFSKETQGERVLLNINWQQRQMLAGASSFINLVYARDLWRL